LKIIKIKNAKNEKSIDKNNNSIGRIKIKKYSK